jgi:molybdenum cofactor biosynthesis enzyme MoaA
MDDIPAVIIREIEKAKEEGIDIKIDTIIVKGGDRKEIKIEVKAGNN